MGRWPRRNRPSARSRVTISEPPLFSSQILVINIARLRLIKPHLSRVPALVTDIRRELSDNLIVRHRSSDPGRIAGYYHTVRNVARDYCSGRNQGIFADCNAGAQDTAAADPGGAQDPRRTPVEFKGWPPI